jgi:hypothetical protein
MPDGYPDPVLTADVGRLCYSLLLAQNPDDLLFREPARLHGPSPIRGDGLYPFLEEFAGLRSPVEMLIRGALKRWCEPIRATLPRVQALSLRNAGEPKRARFPALHRLHRTGTRQTIRVIVPKPV